MKLYEIGNLYGNNPYGVKVWIGWFGSYELHGPFGSENQAHNYAVGQVNDRRGEVTSAEVVKIETPLVGEKLLHSVVEEAADPAEFAERNLRGG